MIVIGILLLSGGLSNCGQSHRDKDYLVSFDDTIKNQYGYKNQNGDIVIPPGKYSMCFTDTFTTYAIVTMPHKGFLAIDRKENILYEVFPFDNGPDEPSDGLFRIIGNHKIGYADAITGKVVIKPQFSCAQPFENGIAEVSDECTTQTTGEHTSWLSDNWYHIDKSGKKYPFFDKE